MLSIQIKNGYHLRIGASNNNFENTLPALDSDLVNYTIKDPYIFDFISLKNEYKEKELESAMLNRIKDVIIELGKGFSLYLTYMPSKEELIKIIKDEKELYELAQENEKE